MLDFSLVQRFLLLVAGLVFFFLVISLAGFYSAVRPTRITSKVTPRTLGLAYEDITLRTSDNVTLAGWFIPHQNDKAKTIILLHGYPADKGNILPSLSFLSEHYHLLLFDFRYLGASQGSYSTIGAKETADLTAAIEWLKDRGHTELGLWGFSLGGAVALMTAPQHPEVKSVVAEASYASLDELAPQLYLLPGVRYPLAWLTKLWGRLFLGLDTKNVSPALAVENLHIPVLIIHSTNDKVIDFSHAKRIQQALHHNSQAEFWFQENLIHGQLSEEYKQRLTHFFAQHLGN